ncbi:NUDIX hydrolase [Nitrobacter sp.]|uniref:NUDIX hydrolase n=1 Tax=unclassified Nitrobacter TaxID=2620411 RepID=UPI002B784F78|nr:NUDIX hydrolase [Nitrobacter sp.]
MSPPQFPQLAVSAAIFRDGKVLLVRRARPPGKGLHSLPGGRIAFGETVAAALHREVAEETGLEIEIAGLAGWREVMPAGPGDGHFVVMSFAARWIAGEPILNDELDAFNWVAPELPGELRLTEGLQTIVDAARRLVGV